jgi:hypothetical protein
MPAGDPSDRFSLFAIFFSEPETQKKNKKNECQSQIKMGIHRFYPPALDRLCLYLQQCIKPMRPAKLSIKNYR